MKAQEEFSTTMPGDGNIEMNYNGPSWLSKALRNIHATLMGPDMPKGRDF